MALVTLRTISTSVLAVVLLGAAIVFVFSSPNSQQSPSLSSRPPTSTPPGERYPDMNSAPTTTSQREVEVRKMLRENVSWETVHVEKLWNAPGLADTVFRVDVVAGGVPNYDQMNARLTDGRSDSGPRT